LREAGLNRAHSLGGKLAKEIKLGVGKIYLDMQILLAASSERLQLSFGVV